MDNVLPEEDDTASEGLRALLLNAATMDGLFSELAVPDILRRMFKPGEALTDKAGHEDFVEASNKGEFDRKPDFSRVEAINMSGGSVQIRAKHEATVRQMKQAMEALEGVPWYKQYWQTEVDGKELDDAASVLDCGLKDGSKVLLINGAPCAEVRVCVYNATVKWASALLASSSLEVELVSTPQLDRILEFFLSAMQDEDALVAVEACEIWEALLESELSFTTCVSQLQLEKGMEKVLPRLIPVLLNGTL
jgi:hypothetical protein